MLKILHVTDLHYHKPYFDWILQQIDTIDVLCLTGDLIGIEHNNSDFVEKKEQILWVSQWLSQISKPTFLCSGNHDEENKLLNDDELLKFDSSIDDMCSDWDLENNDLATHYEPDFWMNNIKNDLVFSDHSIRTIQNTTFGCAPYGEENLSKFYKCDVLLHHEPPDKTKTCEQQNGVMCGCFDLYLALKKELISPSYVLCGHVHKPKATKSLINKSIILNPGSDFRHTIPKHNIIKI